MVTDKQIKRLKRMLGLGKSLQQSTEAVGIDVKTCRINMTQGFSTRHKWLIISKLWIIETFTLF